MSSQAVQNFLDKRWVVSLNSPPAQKRSGAVIHTAPMGGRYGEPPPYAVSHETGMFARSDAVHTAASDIANRVAAQQYQTFYQDENGEEVEDRGNKALALLADPAPGVTSFALKRFVALDRLLTGNSYWFLAGNQSGRPVELWRMHPRRVRVVASGEGGVSGYVYEIDGKVIPLEASEVIHFKIGSPYSEYYGLPPIMAAMLAIQTGVDMMQWNRRTFGKDNAIPAGIVNIQEFISDEDFERVKRDWRDSYGGPERRTAFLRGGTVQYESIGLSQRELDFMETAQWTDTKIYRTLGAYHLLAGMGQGDDKVQERMFLEGTLHPALIDIGETISDRLLPFFSTRAKSLVGRFPDVRPRERALELEEDREQSKGLLFNEWRKERSLDPVPGGDEVLFTHVVGNGFLLPSERALLPLPPSMQLRIPEITATGDSDDNSQDDKPATAGELADERAERRESANDDRGDEIGGFADKAVGAEAIPYVRPTFGFDLTLAAQPVIQEIRKQIEEHWAADEWVASEDWHLSLLYAAEPVALEVVKELFWFLSLSEWDAPTLIPERLEIFNPDVSAALVVRIQMTSELKGLQRYLHDQLTRNKIIVGEYTRPENWKPHVTLAYGASPKVGDPALGIEGAQEFTGETARLMYDSPAYELRRWRLNTATGKTWAAFNPADIGNELKVWERWATKRATSSLGMSPAL